MRWFSAAVLIGWTATLACAQTTSPSKSKDPPKQPTSDVLKVAGKSFNEWLKELSAKDPSKRETAIRAVCAFPPETAIKAIPPLLVEMRKHLAPNAVDLSVRCSICVALTELFGSGEKIDPKLQAEAVTLLRYAMRDTQAMLRYRALVALTAIGPGAHAAIPEITIALKDITTWEVRQAAAGALGAIAHEGTNGPSLPVLKSLYAQLGDPAYQVRLAAVQALSVLGPPSDKELSDNYVKSLLPVALNDPEPGLQIWARIAIIGATNDFSLGNLDPIAKHATSVDPGVRAQAVQAIGTIGPKAKSKIPALITCLADADTNVQASAMWALGRMGTSAVNALPILEKMSADPNLADFMKRSAKDAAEKIKGK